MKIVMFDHRPSVGGRHNNASFIARQAYSFPLLKTNEIVLTLKEIGIPVMEENLSHPEKGINMNSSLSRFPITRLFMR